MVSPTRRKQRRRKFPLLWPSLTIVLILRLGSFLELHRGLSKVKMSTLRRRVLGDTPPSTEPSREPSPAKGEPVALVSKSHLKELKGKRGKRWQFSIFGLGGLFGLVVAAIFANQHDVINLEGLVDFNMESLLDVIPAGIVNDAKDLTVRCFPLARSTWETHKLKLIRSSCS